MKTIYAVTAYLAGDAHGHSYVVGIFTDPNAARNAADTEHARRGGKYATVITVHNDNQYSPETFRVAKEVYRRKSGLEIFRARNLTA